MTAVLSVLFLIILFHENNALQTTIKTSLRLNFHEYIVECNNEV